MAKENPPGLTSNLVFRIFINFTGEENEESVNYAQPVIINAKKF